jgi:hypothetical protein
MALMFADGFDFYDTLLQKWTVAFQAEIATVAARNGPNGCLIDAGGGIAKSLPLQGEFWIGFAYQAPGVGTNLLYGLSSIAIGGGFANWLQLRVESDGSLSIYSSGGFALAGNTATSSPPFYIVPGVFFYIELHVLLGGGTPGTITCTLKVNTKAYLSGVTANCNFSTSALMSQAASANYHNFASGISSGQAYIDDLYINDNTAVASQPAANDFRGDIRVGPYIVPRLDNTINWSGFPSIPPSYPLVNEVPPDGDSSYIYDTNVNDIDDFFFSLVPSFVGEIQAAHLNVFARKDNEGTREIAPIVGGSINLTPTMYLADEYYYYTFPMDVDPGGGVWTVASINAQVFGVQVIA